VSGGILGLIAAKNAKGAKRSWGRAEPMGRSKGHLIETQKAAPPLAHCPFGPERE